MTRLNFQKAASSFPPTPTHATRTHSISSCGISVVVAPDGAKSTISTSVCKIAIGEISIKAAESSSLAIETIPTFRFDTWASGTKYVDFTSPNLEKKYFRSEQSNPRGSPMTSRRVWSQRAPADSWTLICWLLGFSVFNANGFASWHVVAWLASG